MVGGGGGGTGWAVWEAGAGAGDAALAAAGRGGAAAAAVGGDGAAGAGAAAAGAGGVVTGGAGRAAGAIAWAVRGCRSSSVYLAFSRSATRPWVNAWRSAGVLARVGRPGTVARFGAALAWASDILVSVVLAWAAVRDDDDPVADRYHSIGLTASGTDEQPFSAKTTRTDGPHDRLAAISASPARFSTPARVVLGVTRPPASCKKITRN